MKNFTNAIAPASDCTRAAAGTEYDGLADGDALGEAGGFVALTDGDAADDVGDGDPAD